MPGRNVPFPPMEAELVQELPTGELAVRAEVGRLPRDPRERRRRACALVAQRAAAASLLPGARAAREAASAPLRARRRDRDLEEGPARLRLDAAPAPPGREPDPEALGRDPGAVHRLRHPALEGREDSRAAAREAAQGARAEGEAVPALAVQPRPGGRGALARPARGGRAGRRRREAARLALPARLARRRRQGQEVQDGRLRDRRVPLQREGGGADLDAPPRALRQRRRARLRRPLLRADRPAVRKQIEAELPKLRAPGFVSDKRIPGGQSRWTQGRELDWNPVRPELVCEVRYDKLEKNRFRHGTRFIRFRPDKDPKDCTWRQVRPPRRRGDPTVESLLGAREACSGARRFQPPWSLFHAERQPRRRPLSSLFGSAGSRSSFGKSGMQAPLVAPHALRQVADLVDPLAHRRQREPLRLDRRAPRPSRAARKRARPESDESSTRTRSSGRARSGRSRRTRRAGRRPSTSSSQPPGRRSAARPPAPSPSPAAAPPGIRAPA